LLPIPHRFSVPFVELPVGLSGRHFRLALWNLPNATRRNFRAAPARGRSSRELECPDSVSFRRLDGGKRSYADEETERNGFTSRPVRRSFTAQNGCSKIREQSAIDISDIPF